jgi:hypothetical protein
LQLLLVPPADHATAPWRSGVGFRAIWLLEASAPKCAALINLSSRKNQTGMKRKGCRSLEIIKPISDAFDFG